MYQVGGKKDSLGRTIARIAGIPGSHRGVRVGHGHPFTPMVGFTTTPPLGISKQKRTVSRVTGGDSEALASGVCWNLDVRDEGKSFQERTYIRMAKIIPIDEHFLVGNCFVVEDGLAARGSRCSEEEVWFGFVRPHPFF